MRLAALSLIGSLALTAAATAMAAPVMPTTPAPNTANLIQVSYGCGWGYHPNGFGYCVPNYYAYPHVFGGWGHGWGHGGWGHGWGHGGGHWHH